MGTAIPSVSIIVPTYGEAENLPVLIPQIAQVMRTRGWVWEIIVIDDNSQDGTAAVLEKLSTTFHQLRYKIRIHERSLSSAVLAGVAMAHHDYIAVMDGDLSHSPEAIPELVDKLICDAADFVIGFAMRDGRRHTGLVAMASGDFDGGGAALSARLPAR